MRIVHRLVISAVLCGASVALLAAQTPAHKPSGVVMRQPFTQKLKIDKDHYQEERYDRRIPYVSENEVYLFLGDKFGVNVTVQDGRIVSVRYQPDVAEADVWFKFEQPPELPGGVGMTLAIENKMKHGLSMEAKMSVPNKKGEIQTSILPVKAGKSGLETWPHAISQLVLGNLQLTKDSVDEPKK